VTGSQAVQRYWPTAHPNTSYTLALRRSVHLDRGIRLSLPPPRALAFPAHPPVCLSACVPSSIPQQVSGVARQCGTCADDKSLSSRDSLRFASAPFGPWQQGPSSMMMMTRDISLVWCASPLSLPTTMLSVVLAVCRVCCLSCLLSVVLIVCRACCLSCLLTVLSAIGRVGHIGRVPAWRRERRGHSAVCPACLNHGGAACCTNSFGELTKAAAKLLGSA
jgi:hypothetical protein